MRYNLLIAGALAASVAITGALGQTRVVSAKGAEILSKYKPTGEVASCLPLRQIDQMTFVEDRIILIKMNSGKLYFNQASSDCNGARGNRRIEYVTSSPSLCRHDIIRVVDNGSGMSMGSCSLGAFEHVEEKAEG